MTVHACSCAACREFAAPSAQNPVAGITTTGFDEKFFNPLEVLPKQNGIVEDGGLAMNRLN